VCVCGVALRRATEKTLSHRIPIGEKKFTKSENTFKTCRKRRKHKGLPSHGKAGPQANEPSHRSNNGPWLHWQQLSMPEDIQARRYLVAILWVIVKYPRGIRKSKQVKQ